MGSREGVVRYAGTLSRPKPAKQVRADLMSVECQDSLAGSQPLRTEIMKLGVLDVIPSGARLRAAQTGKNPRRELEEV